MSKCRTSKCNAACCYNIVLPKGFLEKHKNDIITPVISTVPLSPHPERGFYDEQVACNTTINIQTNKCPFLRRDLKCNVYDDRPRICRIFGDIPELACKFRK